MPAKPKQPIEYLDSVIALITSVVDDESTHCHRTFKSVIRNIESLIPEGGQNFESGKVRMPNTTKEGIIEFIAIAILMHRINVHFLGTNYNNRTDHVMHQTLAAFCRYFVGDLERVNLIGSCPMEHTYRLVLNKVGGEDAELPELRTATNNDQHLSDYVSKYWNKYHSKLSKMYGIVFTPAEAVDFIVHSVNDIYELKRGVAIQDPFMGAGIFITRLLETRIIPAEDLEYKYLNDIFGNEIVLYSYYIAILNISKTYEKVTGTYLTFQNLSLADTFQLYEAERPSLSPTKRTRKPVIKPRVQGSLF